MTLRQSSVVTANLNGHSSHFSLIFMAPTPLASLRDFLISLGILLIRDTPLRGA